MRDQDEVERIAEAEVRLAHFLAQQIKHATTYFGYPEVPDNNDLSILGISGLAKLHLNNAGDPWIQGNAKMHTKDFEQEVIAFFARLFDLDDDHWGYVTSGGTEGNLYGAYMGRERIQHGHRQPVFVFSEASHYSVKKSARLLGVPSRVVAADAHGEIAYADLEAQLAPLRDASPEAGVIFNLNAGTTMHGAMDDLERVGAVLDRCGFPREARHIHVDAALHGLLVPFTGRYPRPFENGADSLAISGHKFLGAIHPCGVVITRRARKEQSFGEDWVPYVGSADTTITGSRNGFLALNMWYLIRKKGLETMRREALTCIQNARRLAQQLRERDVPDVGHVPGQIIVTFRCPSPPLAQRYQLAVQGGLAHVVCMQHITPHRLVRFVDEIAADFDRSSPAGRECRT